MSVLTDQQPKNGRMAILGLNNGYLQTVL